MEITRFKCNKLPMASAEGASADYVEHLNQSIREILRREFQHELTAERSLCTQTPYGQIFGINTDDQHFLDFLPQLRRLYSRITQGRERAVVPTHVEWARLPGFKLTRLGLDLLDACWCFAFRVEEEGRAWRSAYSDYQFHPVVSVMLGAVIRWSEPINMWGESSQSRLEGESLEPIEAMNAFVDFVRSVCASQAFRNLLHDHDQQAEDNFRSGCDFAYWLYGRFSRLTILRIDLYCRPDARGYGYSAIANAAITKYLRGLRRDKQIPGYLGCIIKRENGISRGVHFHLMVFLNGHEQKSAWYLTQHLGHAWMKRMGAAKGSFFNCYAQKDRYRFNGLGLVHISDLEKLIGLRVALWYMSKQDCSLKVDDSKVRNFWRSPIRGKRSGRGAPRRNGLELVERALGGKRSKYPLGFNPRSPARTFPKTLGTATRSRSDASDIEHLPDGGNGVE